MDPSPEKWTFLMRMWCFEHSALYGPILGSMLSSNTFHTFVKSCPNARVPLIFPRDPCQESFDFYTHHAGEKWTKYEEENPEACFYKWYFNQRKPAPLTKNFIYTVHGKPANEQKQKSTVYMVHGVTLPPTREIESQVLELFVFLLLFPTPARIT